MVKYLNFHNSSFALKLFYFYFYFIFKIVNGKAKVWDPPCWVVWFQPLKIYIPIPFWQQITKYLFKFEILTSTPGFLILKISTSNGYTK